MAKRNASARGTKTSKSSKPTSRGSSSAGSRKGAASRSSLRRVVTPRIPARVSSKLNAAFAGHGRSASVDPSAYVDTKAGKRTPFKKGNPGRPKGSKDKIPRGMHKTIKQIVGDLIEQENLTLRRAILNGIRSGPHTAHQYIRLAAEYNEGKPKETLDLNTQFSESKMEQAARGMKKKMDLLMATILKQKKEREGGSDEIPDSGSQPDPADGTEAVGDHDADGDQS